MIRLLNAWGRWVRDGRTWPNTLGYPKASPGHGDGVEPATDYTGLTRWHYAAEDKHHIESPPVQKSSRVKQSRTRVPMHFTGDREIEQVDKIIGRLSADMHALLNEIHIRGRSCRDVAGSVEASPATVAKLYSTALGCVFGALRLSG